jgi:hypothetical protein
MALFNYFVQIVIGLVGAAYLLPISDVIQEETHIFRWSTDPDLNNSLCAIARPSHEYENNSPYFSLDSSKSLV